MAICGEFIIVDTGFNPRCADTGTTLGKEFNVRRKIDGGRIGSIYMQRPGRWLGVRMSGSRTGPLKTKIAAAQSLT